MYQMAPIYFKPEEGLERHTHTVAKDVLLVAAAIAILALVVILLALTHIAWLRLLNWYGAEWAPVVFGRVLAGI